MRLADLAAADCADAAALMRESYAEAFGASMTAADLAGILSGLTATSFRQSLESHRMIGARLGDRLAGFVQIGPASPQLCQAAGLQAGSEPTELRRLYVLPQDQGNRIGRSLLTAALSRIGAATTLLDVWIGNQRAIALYRRHGFTVVGEVYPDFASGPAPDPDLIMLRHGSG